MIDLKHLGRLTLALTLSAALLSGCADNAVTTQAPPAQGTPVPTAPAPRESLPDSPTYTDPGSEDRTTAGETLLDEDGTYSSAEDVALYLHTYGELPDNFITKAEARDLGWSGGGLDDYLEGAWSGTRTATSTTPPTTTRASSCSTRPPDSRRHISNTDPRRSPAGGPLYPCLSCWGRMPCQSR